METFYKTVIVNDNFFNIIILSEIINKLKKKKFDFIYFLSLLSFIFINIVFYRISEHGTDRSSQILLIIIFLLFFDSESLSHYIKSCTSI